MHYPAYSGERYLTEAIDSVLKQTYHYVKPIAVDSALTDGTVDTIGSYGRRIREFHQKKFGPLGVPQRGIECRGWGVFRLEQAAI